MGTTEFYVEPQLVSEGKVREVYKIADDRVVLVASDRVSAFDEVLDGGIPDKGKILTQMSAFWFQETRSIVPNAFITADSKHLLHPRFRGPEFAERTTEMQLLRMVPLEIIVRGYITGSAWKDYQAGGREICGNKLPDGLQNCEKLPEPIVTPTTKAPVGEHDQNVTREEAAKYLIQRGGNKSPDLKRYIYSLDIASELVDILCDYALELYEYAAAYASQRGVIIADTKFEFGLDQDCHILLADEALTPDSSRFWPADEYEVGREQNSFDKQIVRDYIADAKTRGEKVDHIPAGIVDKTRQRYWELYHLLVPEKY